MGVVGAVFEVLEAVNTYVSGCLARIKGLPARTGGRRNRTPKGATRSVFSKSRQMRETILLEKWIEDIEICPVDAQNEEFRHISSCSVRHLCLWVSAFLRFCPRDKTTPWLPCGGGWSAFSHAHIQIIYTRGVIIPLQAHVSHSSLKLNVGAGKSDWGDVRLDIKRTPSISCRGDMHSLPFNSDTFAEVLLDNVLEHTAEVQGVLREVHRVLQPGGIAYLYVPYYNSHGAAADPTHRSFFSENTFEYYARESDFNYYADFEFELVQQEFWYSKLLLPVPFRRVRLKLGHMIGDLVLAMKTVLRKPGGTPVEPTIQGWLSS